MNKLEVSVCIVAYNQAAYIDQCLQSIVAQQVDFPFEVIVADDCSTDNTRAIIERHVKQSPELLRTFYQEKNVGAVANLVSAYRQAKGRYIAHLDGDDYALPGKLQQQHDALESHPTCMICAHDVRVVDANDHVIRRNIDPWKKEINTLWDLYEHLPFFTHSSKMFVNDMDDPFWQTVTARTLDIEIHVNQARKGNIVYLPKVLGAYRQNVGISLRHGKLNPNNIAAVDRVFDQAVRDATDDRQAISELKAFHANQLAAYAYQSALLGDSDGFVAYIKRSIEIGTYTRKQQALRLLSQFPPLAIALCQSRDRLINFCRNIRR